MLADGPEAIRRIDLQDWIEDRLGVSASDLLHLSLLPCKAGKTLIGCILKEGEPTSLLSSLVEASCASVAVDAIGPGRAFRLLELKLTYPREIPRLSCSLQIEGTLISVSKSSIIMQSIVRDLSKRVYATAVARAIINRDVVRRSKLCLHRD